MRHQNATPRSQVVEEESTNKEVFRRQRIVGGGGGDKKEEQCRRHRQCRHPSRQIEDDAKREAPSAPRARGRRRELCSCCSRRWCHQPGWRCAPDVLRFCPRARVTPHQTKKGVPSRQSSCTTAPSGSRAALLLRGRPIPTWARLAEKARKSSLRCRERSVKATCRLREDTLPSTTCTRLVRREVFSFSSRSKSRAALQALSTPLHVIRLGEEGAATSPKSNGHGPHSPTSPSRHGLSRHGSSHSFSQDDLAHFNPLDELAGFFEAQLEKRNPQVHTCTSLHSSPCTRAHGKNVACARSDSQRACACAGVNAPFAGCSQGEGVQKARREPHEEGGDPQRQEEGELSAHSDP